MTRTDVILLLLTWNLITSRGLAQDDVVDFRRDIRPILSDKCFQCHGPDEKQRKAGLRLDTESGAKGPRKDRPAVVPNDPAASMLLKRITSNDLDERMPPAESGKSLTPREQDLLRRWVVQGAPWGEHWAYLPPRHHQLPNKKIAAEDNWIDAYILERLQRQDLTHSPEADRVTLARRLSFDLLGLPPKPKDVDRFVADRDPHAYERFVDGLLSSEHFGERMAVHWLDLVRYADTVGYHGDQDHHASPYRDYVIDAFNLNVPFDRFTREQLAGDLIPGGGTDQKIATCYNRLLQTSHEGGVQPKEYLAIYAADRVRNVSAVWIGATLGCAQCHDHKYDPFTQKDFYSLAAFFADVDEEKHLRGAGTDTVPTKRPPESSVHTRRERQRLQQLHDAIARLEVRLAEATTKEQSLRQVMHGLIYEWDALHKSARLVMVTQAIPPRPVRILPRGNWLDESGPVVEPAVPAFLGKIPGQGRRPTRLDLARWLTDPKHGAGGLTARVFVNRLWALFFGQGLSRSMEDFGNQGEPPSHPELLDRLACEFFEKGWDVKHMVRLIVTSRTYRQASLVSPVLRERDPENRLFARQARFRLPAEFVRDNALAVAGLLVTDVGGASVKPHQPAGYYRHLNFPKREYKAHTDNRQWRRGVYVHWQRQFLHPMLKAFDAPSREECTAQRPRSNTPLAALVLMNDPTFLEAARALAARIFEHADKTDEGRIHYAFQLALSRPPDAFETAALQRVLEASRIEYQAAPEAARQFIRRGLSAAVPKFNEAELAAWMAVSRTIMNLSEMHTRN
jgi:hypothetical protein